MSFILQMTVEFFFRLSLYRVVRILHSKEEGHITYLNLLVSLRLFSEKVIVKNVYLKHHQEFPLPIVSEDPVAPIYPIAPVLPVAPGLLPVGKPIARSVHAEPAVNTAPIVHAPPAPIVAEKPTAPALTGSQIVIKKPEPQYKGHYIYKKFVKNPGHHFGVHNYQISFSRRPMPVIVKKHFVLHPSPIVLKPVFLKKPVAKPDIPIVNSEAAVPIIKEGPPIADAEIAVPATRPVIKETPVATGHVIENTAEPVAEEPLVEHGAPILEILGSIFDAPLLNTGVVAHGIPIADKAC